MSVLQARGGIPYVIRESIDGTGRKFRLPFFGSSVMARNKGAVIVRLYFTEKDFDDDANYVELPVPAAIDPYGEWAAPAEVENIWMRSSGAPSAVEVVVFQRRG